MKIGYDAKRLFHNSSGLGNYSRDLVRVLSSYSKELDLLLFSKSSSPRAEKLLENQNVQFVPLKKGSLSRQRLMGIQAQKEGCDLFHGLSGELPLRWGKAPIGKIVTIHDLIFLRLPKYYSFFDRKVHEWKFKKACASADRIIAISERTQNDLIELLKVDPKKISVVYQGCHASFKESKSEEKRLEVKEKFALPSRFILSVGTIEERKNLLSVVLALSELKDLDIPLVVVGRKTPYAKKVERLIKTKKLSEKVQFLSGVSMEELSSIYRLADFSVYASHYEGFGIPVIESLYSGTPVIASNSSCLQEAGGEAALYVDPKNPSDIKSKISYLWQSEAERKRRSELGLKFVQKFNDENIFSQMLELYQQVYEERVKNTP